MIACDNPSCPIEWFYMSCLNMESIPREKWYCPDCELNFKNKKIDSCMHDILIELYNLQACWLGTARYSLTVFTHQIPNRTVPHRTNWYGKICTCERSLRYVQPTHDS